jgi:hypothetical protein
MRAYLYFKFEINLLISSVKNSSIILSIYLPIYKPFSLSISKSSSYLSTHPLISSYICPSRWAADTICPSYTPVPCDLSYTISIINGKLRGKSSTLESGQTGSDLGTVNMVVMKLYVIKPYSLIFILYHTSEF